MSRVTKHFSLVGRMVKPSPGVNMDQDQKEFDFEGEMWNAAGQALEVCRINGTLEQTAFEYSIECMCGHEGHECQVFRSSNLVVWQNCSDSSEWFANPI